MKINHEIIDTDTDHRQKRPNVGLFSLLGLPSEISKVMDYSNYHYVYVLKSKKDGKRYVGFTHNLAKRFEQHNDGEVESTRHRGPFEIIYFEACCSQEDAVRREKYLKTHYGRLFLGKRLKSYFIETK